MTKQVQHERESLQETILNNKITQQENKLKLKCLIVTFLTAIVKTRSHTV